MKSIRIIVLGLVILSSILCKASKKGKQEENEDAAQDETTTVAQKDTQSPQSPETKEKNSPVVANPVLKLFTVPPSTDKCTARMKFLTEKMAGEIDSRMNIPFRKENFLKRRRIGFDASAFLFDFLDPVLQKPIVDKFKSIWIEAKKMKGADPKEYKDPYPLNALIEKKRLEKDNAALAVELEEISPDFKRKIWENSITGPQLYNIIKQWKWYQDPMKSDYTKFVLDTYDFGGDGRLNAKEFLLAMLRTNKKIVDSPDPEKRCENCLADIIQTQIDPIYEYNDVCGENAVSAYTLWVNLKKLKRSSNAYDIYQCQLKHGNYRTSAINDFVLKSMKKNEGKLSKIEFRMGILYGYWGRQTSREGVVEDTRKSQKEIRWLSNGEIDKLCMEIQKSLKIR